MVIVAVGLCERFFGRGVADQPEGLGRLGAHSGVSVRPKHDHERSDRARVCEAPEGLGCLEAHITLGVVERADQRLDCRVLAGGAERRCGRASQSGLQTAKVSDPVGEWPRHEVRGHYAPKWALRTC
jgi:hypothetical protein